VSSTNRIAGDVKTYVDDKRPTGQSYHHCRQIARHTASTLSYLGSIEIGCDGKSALQTALEYEPILSDDLPDFDILGAIYYLRTQSRINWSFRHVKGHQDQQGIDLDLWAQRNIQMDMRAKEHLLVAKRTPRYFNIPGEPWQLWVKDTKVTKNIFTILYDAVHSTTSEDYWCSKFSWRQEESQSIDWKLVGKAMKALPRSRRFFISKHVSGMCGVGKFMQCWREWESLNCPRCGLFEDAQHVWRCKGLGTEEIWNKAVIDLEHTMRKLDTDPTLAHIITKYLKGWWLDKDTLYEPPRAFLSLLQKQTNIGWGRFFEGLWATDWA
jgi:hypothetical protein